MKDQVSLGSQPQYRPQAASAQMAPQMMAKVQIGNANACTRKVIRSSPSDGGSRSPSENGKRVRPASYPARTRVSAAQAKPTSRIPEAVIAAVTWIFSQYELSAGTSGPAFVYSRIPSTPSRMTSVNVTKSPSGRIDGRRTSTTSHAVAPTRVAASTNSYMLPHGTRPAARPRVTRQATWASQPTKVSAAPVQPAHTATRAASGPAPAGRASSPSSTASPDPASPAEDATEPPTPAPT